MGVTKEGGRKGGQWHWHRSVCKFVMLATTLPSAYLPRVRRREIMMAVRSFGSSSGMRTSPKCLPSA